MTINLFFGDHMFFFEIQFGDDCKKHGSVYMHITQDIYSAKWKVKDNPDDLRVEFEENLRAKYCFVSRS